MFERLDFWLAIFTLLALAWFELRLGRFVGPVVRGVMGIAGPAAAHVKRRATRQLPTTVRLKPRPIRDDGGRFNGSLPAVPSKPERNEDESRFALVSGIAMQEDDTETVAFHFLARLVKAGHVTETQALESACGVRAGSSKAYQEARAKLKKAIEDQSKAAVLQEAA